ncbi:glycosyltransferase [Roseicella sp. DB1501]|uniref:glycosyltransferase n=1 Tax=Roseicella sp. DB1501 TaxID=2730925 RepID=UPI0014912B1A|nr:glycosyltransferase family 1 protein [Roseicella sp. DB1501]NOG69934.1 glycosyltransferase family 1 protein [Roseicella sp. DB1501]
MFPNGPPAIRYRDPWSQSFASRLAALSRGAPRVAYFYERPDTSTFRYRCFNMVEALGLAEPGVGASWFCAADLEWADRIIDRADTIVICRARYTPAFARLIGAAKSRGRRVLFDVDDLIFDTRFTHLVLDTLDQNTTDTDLDFWFAAMGRIGETMRLCDGVILTNEFLARRATDFCGLPTWVVPNFLNGAQLDISAQIVERKRASGWRRDGRIHLGYFSGTPSHNRDFAIIADTLAELLQRDRRLVLRIVGFLEPRGRLAGLSERIERFPLQDFLNLQRLIGEVELNLVPLQDNTFTNCKSELKIFEASITGTISIASPSFTLRRAIEEGETGYLAPAHRWEEVLLHAIDRLEDYPHMAEAALAMAEDRYGPARQAAAIMAAAFG